MNQATTSDVFNEVDPSSQEPMGAANLPAPEDPQLGNGKTRLFTRDYKIHWLLVLPSFPALLSALVLPSTPTLSPSTRPISTPQQVCGREVLPGQRHLVIPLLLARLLTSASCLTGASLDGIPIPNSSTPSVSQCQAKPSTKSSSPSAAKSSGLQSP